MTVISFHNNRSGNVSFNIPLIMEERPLSESSFCCSREGDRNDHILEPFVERNVCFSREGNRNYLILELSVERNVFCIFAP